MVNELFERREVLKSEIAGIGDLRPGSLVGRFRKCGKPTCHCAQPGDPGHGPSWSLTKVVEGKTVTRVIPAGPAVEQTQAQIEECRRLRRLTQELIDVSEALCEAQLEPLAEEPVTVKKKHSNTRSSSRSLPKSPP
jgi:hypothetical protein